MITYIRGFKLEKRKRNSYIFDVQSVGTSEIVLKHEEHERVSETGVFPSLDRVSETPCLSHYVTETSHLHSLRDFWRHFGLCGAAAHSDCCFLAPCTNILTYLLTYLLWLAETWFVEQNIQPLSSLAVCVWSLLTPVLTLICWAEVAQLAPQRLIVSHAAVIKQKNATAPSADVDKHCYRRRVYLGNCVASLLYVLLRLTPPVETVDTVAVAISW